MSTYKGTIKKWKSSGSIWDILYPQTTMDQVISLNTSLANMQSDIDDKTKVYFINNATGSSGVWAATVTGIDSYYDGLFVHFKLPSSGASSCTLNINGLGAKTIYRYSNSLLTTHFTTNYIIPLVYDSVLNGGCWVVAGDPYDSNETYHDRSDGYFQAGATIYDYKIVMEGSDGKMYPLTLENGTGTTKTVSQQPFLIDGKIFWYGSTTDLAADAVSRYYWYPRDTISTLNYTANQSGGWTAYKPMYLKGTIDANGYFVLDNTTYTSWLTQTIPTSDDGFVYIYLGHMHDTGNTLVLGEDHSAYQFTNGTFHLYSPLPYEIDLKSDFVSVSTHQHSYDIKKNQTIMFNSTSTLYMYMDADNEGGSFEIGDSFTILKMGTGAVYINASGATIYRNIDGTAGSGSCYVGGRYMGVTFIKIGASQWMAIGLLSSTAVN